MSAFKEEIMICERIENKGPFYAKDRPDLATELRNAILELPEDKSKRVTRPDLWKRTYFVAWEKDGGLYHGEEVVVTFMGKKTDPDGGKIMVSTKATYRKDLP
jgi:hypothetical protein